MSEITIQKSEYEELLKNKSEVKNLLDKVNSLEEESNNKTQALKEARSKAKDDLADKQAELETANTELNWIKTKLWENDLDAILNNSSEYWKIQEEKLETSKTNIENYKKLLWDDLKNYEEFLSEDDVLKNEKILHKFTEAKGLLKDEWNSWENKPWLKIWEVSGWSVNPDKSDFQSNLNSAVESWDIEAILAL